VVDRAGDRAEAPAGAVEERGFGDVRELPADDVALPDPELAQAARDRGDVRVLR
jgi:hypothetical protein